MRRPASQTDVTGLFESQPKAQAVVSVSGDDSLPASAGALPRRKTKRQPTKKGDVKHFLASQKTRQQDRIADDYYRLLHLQG